MQTVQLCHLEEFKKSVEGKARLGVEIFAKALLCIPKCLIENSGFDVQETLLRLQEKHEKTKTAVGIDIMTGEVLVPADAGISELTRLFLFLIFLERENPLVLFCVSQSRGPTFKFRRKKKKIFFTAEMVVFSVF